MLALPQADSLLCYICTGQLGMHTQDHERARVKPAARALLPSVAGTLSGEERQGLMHAHHGMLELGLLGLHKAGSRGQREGRVLEAEHHGQRHAPNALPLPAGETATLSTFAAGVLKAAESYSGQHKYCTRCMSDRDVG